ncbi:hypothetical protein BN970_01357 [Mycolicibacterium conceptionense]|uniref:SpoVT-AbrB domain-containing protein n=1 Tax=Mycolicibacterium conceptionense TaxID=451644 RepID=A0A0U1D366_9MYCO|nr:hypothetical protein [Mycolicibacterium conceptionense]ORV20955.1 hypothetical protein AWB98_01255 [Mycolicibacterium conceptionense]CQD07223.1 hypothetical protein BN970_01357 [Mycolicibacterium conceptionense]
MTQHQIRINGEEVLLPEDTRIEIPCQGRTEVYSDDGVITVKLSKPEPMPFLDLLADCSPEEIKAFEATFV